MEIVEADFATPSERPLLFVKPLEGEAEMFELGAYSAVAPEINPGEMVWLEFQFLTSAEFDAEFLPAVDAVEGGESSSPEQLASLLKRFSAPQVTGVNVSVQDTTYEALRLKN
jgi:hypothetical protein